MQKTRSTARRGSPYFAAGCSDAELREQLRRCGNSGFYVSRDAALGCVTVHDRDTVILHAVEMPGAWLVRLHRMYYRHPFGPPSDGGAPPGVP